MENEKNTKKGSSVDNNANVLSKKKCGIIMPITDTVGYPPNHWQDVLSILCEAASQTDFEAQLVSDDDAIGLIHDRIVTNIYNNDIIICDVSSKNPNVMFELGMRLAFDKPTIIIKDENTDYAFDTGGIEHIPYPCSLRYHLISEFKAKLIKSINATYEKSSKDSNYSPFLKSFGRTLIPASIEGNEVPESKYIIETLGQLKRDMYFLRKGMNNNIESAFIEDSNENYSHNAEYIKFRNQMEEINRLLSETDNTQKRNEYLRLKNSLLMDYKKNNNTIIR